MKYPLRFGTVVWLICSAFLFAQSNPTSTIRSYRYELSTRSQENKFANEILSTVGVGGTRYEVETDAQGRIMRAATIRKGQKLSEILYRFAADAKLPSEYESFVAGEKTGVVRIQRDEAGNRIRENYFTVGGTLTRYDTYSYSPDHVEDVHYAADGKKTGYYDLYYSAKDTLIRAIYYFITDAWYTDTEFDDGTGLTKLKKEFNDGKLKATVSCTYNADGDLSRCDTDAALRRYATEEFNDDLPTKRTYKEANGATKELQFKFDEKRWLKESALYYEGVLVCRFVYDRLPDGTVKRTLALGPNGELWAEYPDIEITNVQRNGEAPVGKSIIHKTGNWWNPSSTEQKQEAPASSGSPSQVPSADGHAPPSTPPGVTMPLMHICAPDTPTPSRCATPPHAVFAPDPEYSEEARKAHYEGTCVLWTIVGTDGRVQNTKVARRLGHGLDEKAIEAVKLWKFEPAMYEGKPVAVQINIEVTFRAGDVVVSPTSAQLVTGAKQQFSATVWGATNSAVNWSVGGSGCAASACGSISADGLYTAPLSIPNPAAVIVTATSATDPIKTGKATVTIQPRSQ